MALCEHTTAQKLMNSFMQFKKIGWQRRESIGHKPSEIMVLLSIYKKEQRGDTGATVSEISAQLHVTLPTVTQIANALETNGLVKRTMDPSDRRVVRITLTQQGKILAQEAVDTFTASFNGLIEYLGEEQSHQLADLLSKVFLYFNEIDPQRKQLKNRDEVH